MVTSLLVGLLSAQRPPSGLDERLRAVRAVVIAEAKGENRRFKDLNPAVGFGGRVYSESEQKRIEASLPAWAKPHRSQPSFLSLWFARIDPLGPHRYRVGVMPSTHPYTPPTYDTYVVALSNKGDRIVSKRSGRVLAKGQPRALVP